MRVLTCFSEWPLLLTLSNRRWCLTLHIRIQTTSLSVTVGHCCDCCSRIAAGLSSALDMWSRYQASRLRLQLPPVGMNGQLTITRQLPALGQLQPLTLGPHFLLKEKGQEPIGVAYVAVLSRQFSEDQLALTKLLPSTDRLSDFQGHDKLVRRAQHFSLLC